MIASLAMPSGAAQAQTTSARKAAASNATRPVDFWTEPPPLVSLGFEWRVAGDDNGNAKVEVSYRKHGEKT